MQKIQYFDGEQVIFDYVEKVINIFKKYKDLLISKLNEEGQIIQQQKILVHKVEKVGEIIGGFLQIQQLFQSKGNLLQTVYEKKQQSINQIQKLKSFCEDFITMNQALLEETLAKASEVQQETFIPIMNKLIASLSNLMIILDEIFQLEEINKEDIVKRLLDAFKSLLVALAESIKFEVESQQTKGTQS